MHELVQQWNLASYWFASLPKKLETQNSLFKELPMNFKIKRRNREFSIFLVIAVCVPYKIMEEAGFAKCLFKRRS